MDLEKLAKEAKVLETKQLLERMVRTVSPEKAYELARKHFVDDERLHDLYESIATRYGRFHGDNEEVLAHLTLGLDVEAIYEPRIMEAMDNGQYKSAKEMIRALQEVRKYADKITLRDKNM